MTKQQTPMTKTVAEPATVEPKKRPFDLEERTARFGEALIAFCRKLPTDVVTMRLADQLVRSGTSVGANYCEADDAVSRKDFHHKIGICKKEARETKYWLRMIAAAVADKKEDARVLWSEAKELHLIFAAIFKKTGTAAKK